jgi:hypothetical protein
MMATVQLASTALNVHGAGRVHLAASTSGARLLTAGTAGSRGALTLLNVDGTSALQIVATPLQDSGDSADIRAIALSADGGTMAMSNPEGDVMICPVGADGPDFDSMAMSSHSTAVKTAIAFNAPASHM